MWKKTTLAILALLLAATAAGAGDETQWLHVAVDEDEERVRVNIPLTLVAAILPLIEEQEFRHGRVILDDEEFDREDIVAMLAAVAAAEDGEYVTIDDRHDHVRVSKRGDEILVHVEERGRRGEEIEARVDVRIPVAVLEALTSAGEDELDVLAAIETLGEKELEGDLVTVTEDGSRVRVWIDRRNESD